MDDNGVEFRSQLYATIHDRVTAAIEAKKQEIAGNLIRQEEKEEEEGMGKGHEKAEKKMMKSLDKNGDGKHTMADHKMEEVEQVSEAEKEEGAAHEKGEKGEKEEMPSNKKPSLLGAHFGRKSSSGGKTTETKTGRVHTSGSRY